LRELFSSWGVWITYILTNKFVALTLGGAAGTNARYWLARWFDELNWTKGFPLGTFVINVTGSFILGMAMLIIYDRLPPAHEVWALLICTGFCGGFTTFSTFEWETFKLVRDGSHWYALLNVAGSVVVGFLGVILASILFNLFFSKQ
jgi:CrcB protein